MEGGHGELERAQIAPEIQTGSTLAAANNAAERHAADTKGQSTATMTLRVLYTAQKTKKRKTWSDGAVQCCSQRLLVTLYRWSEVLGATGGPLAQSWLTQPEYAAFVTAAEPELDMDGFLVSLDGVVENRPPPAAANNQGPSQRALPAPNGKKRVFRAFKAPQVASLPPPPPPPPPPPQLTYRGPSILSLDGASCAGGYAFDGGQRGKGRTSRGAGPNLRINNGFGALDLLGDDGDEPEDGLGQGDADAEPINSQRGTFGNGQCASTGGAGAGTGPWAMMAAAEAADRAAEPPGHFSTDWQKHQQKQHEQNQSPWQDPGRPFEWQTSQATGGGQGSSSTEQAEDLSPKVHVDSQAQALGNQSSGSSGWQAAAAREARQQEHKQRQGHSSSSRGDEHPPPVGGQGRSPADILSLFEVPAPAFGAAVQCNSLELETAAQEERSAAKASQASGLFTLANEQERADVASNDISAAFGRKPDWSFGGPGDMWSGCEEEPPADEPSQETTIAVGSVVCGCGSEASGGGSWTCECGVACAASSTSCCICGSERDGSAAAAAPAAAALCGASDALLAHAAADTWRAAAVSEGEGAWASGEAGLEGQPKVEAMLLPSDPDSARSATQRFVAAQAVQCEAETGATEAPFKANARATPSEGTVGLREQFGGGLSSGTKAEEALGETAVGSFTLDLDLGSEDDSD